MALTPSLAQQHEFMVPAPCCLGGPASSNVGGLKAKAPPQQRSHPECQPVSGTEVPDLSVALRLLREIGGAVVAAEISGGVVPPDSASGSGGPCATQLTAEPVVVESSSAAEPPAFEAAASFTGARPGCVFKRGDKGLGYYRDKVTSEPEKEHPQIASPADAVRPMLPARWRDAAFRMETLRVDPQKGAGLSLEHCEFGFSVEAVSEHPRQGLAPGDVIVAFEGTDGKVLAGLSAPQMQASFHKRRVHGASLVVASLAEVEKLNSTDPDIVEQWDSNLQHVYYFHKKTGRTAWTREEIEEPPPKEDPEISTQPPVDLSTFLSHGFSAPKAKVRKKATAKSAAEPRGEADVARDERRRWSEWNDGPRGGYTDQFLAKYKNCQAFTAKPKVDKRLKGSVGPGHGMDRFEKWTGSKNSFN